MWSNYFTVVYISECQAKVSPVSLMYIFIKYSHIWITHQIVVKICFNIFLVYNIFNFTEFAWIPYHVILHRSVATATLYCLSEQKPWLHFWNYFSIFLQRFTKDAMVFMSLSKTKTETIIRSQIKHIYI